MKYQVEMRDKMKNGKVDRFFETFDCDSFTEAEECAQADYGPIEVLSMTLIEDCSIEEDDL